MRITSVELFDAVKGTVEVGFFRKGKPASVDVYTVTLDSAAKSATLWTMVEKITSEDDNRPAMIRLTTIRNGDTVETIKQIDFLDDNKDEWIIRNRTRLKRIGS